MSKQLLLSEKTSLSPPWLQTPGRCPHHHHYHHPGNSCPRSSPTPNPGEGVRGPQSLQQEPGGGLGAYPPLTPAIWDPGLPPGHGLLRSPPPLAWAPMGSLWPTPTSQGCLRAPGAFSWWGSWLGSFPPLSAKTWLCYLSPSPWEERGGRKWARASHGLRRSPGAPTPPTLLRPLLGDLVHTCLVPTSRQARPFHLVAGRKKRKFKSRGPGPVLDTLDTLFHLLLTVLTPDFTIKETETPKNQPEQGGSKQPNMLGLSTLPFPPLLAQ